MYPKTKGTYPNLPKRRGPIQIFQNEGGLSKSSKWRKESDLQGLWICKYIESLLPAVQGNKSVLYLGPGHPDTEKRNKSLTDAHSAGLPMRHMAALASSEFSSCHQCCWLPMELSAISASQATVGETHWFAGLRPTRGWGQEKGCIWFPV